MSSDRSSASMPRGAKITPVETAAAMAETTARCTCQLGSIKYYEATHLPYQRSEGHIKREEGAMDGDVDATRFDVELRLPPRCTDQPILRL